MAKERIHQPGGADILRFKELTKAFFEKLQKKRRLRLCVISASIVLWGAVLSGVLEYFFYLPALLKLTLVAGLPLLALSAAVYLKRKDRQTSFTSFYHTFSRQYDIPELANALDLHLKKDLSPNRLSPAAVKQNVDKLDGKKVNEHFRDYVNSQQAVRSLKSMYGVLFSSAVLMVLLIAFQPTAMERLAYAWQNYSPPNPYSYSVFPGSVTLEQGDSFKPSIRFEGEKPADLKLAFKTDIEEKYRSRIPVKTFGDSITFSSLSLNTDGSYYFEMDGHKSEIYRAEIQLLPRFETLTVRVIPPEYTRLDTTTYTYPFSKIQAYRGSNLQLEGRTNKELSSLSLLTRHEADTLTLTADEHSIYSHSFEVSKQDTLSFSMLDTHGLSNKNFFEFVVQPVEDQYPFVQLTKPETNLEMKNPENLLLEYEASDDFGVISVRLHYEIQRAFKKDAEKKSRRLAIPALNRSEEYNWQIPQLNPKPRDIISYWIEAADNDQINGSKKVQSRKLTITFPSLTDFVDELEDRERNAQEKLEDISDSYNQMQQEYERFKEQLKENPEGDWEQKQTIEQVKKQQQEIDEKVKELNEEFEKIRKDIEQSDLLSEESRKAYEELQQLMEEIDDPELVKALEELQKALGNLSQEELRKALENYEFNEQQYQERLKRTIELFKTLKMNSDLDKMAKAFEELSKEEEALSNDQNLDNSEQISKQDAVKKDLEKLEQKLQNLSDNPPQKARQKLDELQKEAGENIDKTKEELQENIDQLQKDPSGKPNDEIKQQQQQIQQQLNKLAQQMRNAQQQMNQQQQQVNITALQYILHSLINLSQNQEELNRETASLSGRSQAFVEKAREEQQIEEQFSQLADSLFKISAQIPGFSNAINKKKNEVQQHLETAVKQLAERDRSKATYAERQSLGGINELSTMIASLLNQLQNNQSQGGGGGPMTMQQFMEQLQQMSGQQQQLNQQIQNFINDIQGDRLSKDQVDRLNQMARQQNKIRKQIEELQKNGGLESGDQVLSELERLSEEMEKTINDLRGGQTDPFLVKRQQNILSRMLNAEKAMQERGEEEKREGTSADDVPQNVPPDVTIEELQKRIRKLLNDPDRTRFSEDYQRLIEQYFKLLRDIQAESDSTSIN